jgi:hypothetical protein
MSAALQSPEAALAPDPAVMRRMLDLLHPDAGSLIEVRCIKLGGKPPFAPHIVSADRDELLAFAAEHNARGLNAYVTLNPRGPGAGTTKDIDIVRRAWLLVDLDPKRRTGQAARAEQEVTAAALAAHIVKTMTARHGWPTPLLAHSGNGVHALYPIDLPNDGDSRALIRGVLLALDAEFSTGDIEVDTGVFNASRVTKLIGSVSHKGTPRPSSIDHDAVPRPLTVEQLRAVAALAPKSATKRQAKAASVAPAGSASPCDPHLAEDLRSALAYIPANCGRNEWRAILGAAKNSVGYATALPIVDAWSATAGTEKYQGSDDVASQLVTADFPNLGAASIFAKAQAAGWENPATTRRVWGDRTEPTAEEMAWAAADCAMFAAMARAKATAQEPRGAERSDPDTGMIESAVHGARRARRFGFVSAADMELKPVDWLVRGYLERDSLSVVFGEPKKGKSFVAIDIACSVASGSDWHGQHVKQGAVFYIAGEGHNGLSRRFHAWRKLRGIDPPRHMLHVSTCAAQLTSAASAAEVSAAVRALADAADCEPALIIVDTLARNFGPADENSTQDMGAFIANLDAELRLPWGAAVMVVHHSGKDAAKGARGSSALFGAVDAQYEVTRDESGIVRLTAHVMKDAEIPAPLAFKLCPVPLPLFDEDGQQVFGATLEPAAYVEPARKGKEGRGKNQTAALHALAELEREHRQRLSDGGYDPEEALVKEDTWIDRLEVLGMSRQRRSEVVSSLIERERVRRTVGGYVELA